MGGQVRANPLEGVLPLRQRRGVRGWHAASHMRMGRLGTEERPPAMTTRIATACCHRLAAAGEHQLCSSQVLRAPLSELDGMIHGRDGRGQRTAEGLRKVEKLVHRRDWSYRTSKTCHGKRKKMPVQASACPPPLTTASCISLSLSLSRRLSLHSPRSAPQTQQADLVRQ